MSDLDDLTTAMRAFSSDRDWEQFHDPKSLVLALTGEVGELAELFQWLPADQAEALARQNDLGHRVAEELSDILLYVIRLADVLQVDLFRAATVKLEQAAARFPVDSVRGRAPAPKGALDGSD